MNSIQTAATGSFFARCAAKNKGLTAEILAPLKSYAHNFMDPKRSFLQHSPSLTVPVNAYFYDALSQARFPDRVRLSLGNFDKIEEPIFTLNLYLLNLLSPFRMIRALD